MVVFPLVEPVNMLEDKETIQFDLLVTLPLPVFVS